ncbi:hypothetical protein HMPREF0428_01933, partial [Gemella haemolysans M341]
TVTFEDITYTEVGEHEYTVTEKQEMKQELHMIQNLIQ